MDLKAPFIEGAQHNLQFGFTQGRSPMMAALICTETIAEGLDNKQPIYVAALDAQKAFDVVDHTSLKLKLFNQRCPLPLWKAETSLLDGLSGQVRIDGDFSRTFHVRQGVGQGKVLSPSQYKTFLDEALIQMTETNIGAFIGHIPVGSPTCADDMLLTSFDKSELQLQLDLAYAYSTRERYILHPAKSQVITVNDKLGADDPLQLGESELPISDHLTHLGIRRQKGKMTADATIDDRTSAARKAMYSLMGAGLHGMNGLPPLVSRTIYSLYILPILLHGLETLILSKKQLQTLEQFHRCTLKRLQTLPTRLSNSMTYLLFGLAPVEAYIDRRIFNLLGRIANQPGSTLHDVLTRQMAVKAVDSKSWVIYAANRLAAYDLPNLRQLLRTPPSMSRWKATTRTAVRERWDAQLRDDAREKSTLRYVNLNACSITKPHRIWEHHQDDPRFVARSLIKARLTTGCYLLQASRQKFNQYEVTATCPLCGEGDEDRLHFIRLYPSSRGLREAVDDYLEQTIPLYGTLTEEER